MSVEQRRKPGPPHQRRHDALRPDRDPQRVSRQLARDRGPVPELEAEGEIERPVRLAEKLAQGFEPCRPAHDGPLPPGLLMSAWVQKDNPARRRAAMR